MWYFFVGVGILFVILLLLIKKPKIYETIELISGYGDVKVQVKELNNHPIYKYAIALCYFAKIRWLVLTEAEICRTILSNVVVSSLNEWPNIPSVDMVSSLNNEILKYTVNLHFSKKSGWYITNKLPRKVHTNDLVTHYFIMLREVVNLLNESESQKLQKLLFEFNSKTKSFNDSSFTGLKELFKEANSMIGQI